MAKTLYPGGTAAGFCSLTLVQYGSGSAIPVYRSGLVALSATCLSASVAYLAQPLYIIVSVPIFCSKYTVSGQSALVPLVTFSSPVKALLLNGMDRVVPSLGFFVPCVLAWRLLCLTMISTTCPGEWAFKMMTMEKEVVMG